MRTCSILFAFALFTAAISHAHDDWPQFRGPNADGKSDAKGIATTWSDTNHVKWKTPVHGKAWSCPVVLGKQVWLTTATKDGKQLSVVQIDRDSGKIEKDAI